VIDKIFILADITWRTGRWRLLRQAPRWRCRWRERSIFSCFSSGSESHRRVTDSHLGDCLELQYCCDRWRRPCLVVLRRLVIPFRCIVGWFYCFSLRFIAKVRLFPRWCAAAWWPLLWFHHSKSVKRPLGAAAMLTLDGRPFLFTFLSCLCGLCVWNSWGMREKWRRDLWSLALCACFARFPFLQNSAVLWFASSKEGRWNRMKVYRWLF
jgi:hypothetical protein